MLRKLYVDYILSVLKTKEITFKVFCKLKYTLPVNRKTDIMALIC